MIYEITSGTIDGPADFKREAMQSAREITKYLKENYPDQNVEFIISATGRAQRVAWVIKCASIEEAQAFGKQRSEDSGYKAIIDKWEAKEAKQGRSSWADGMSREYWIVDEG